MKTFAEIRKYAIEQYSRIAEKQAEVDAAYEKMAGMKIYTPEYLTKIKKAGEAEVAAVRADAAANLEAVVKLTLAEKKTALEKMLATAPSTEQTNLLNTLQVQGNRITPDEIKSIAVQLSGNYRALHALQAIAKEAGHGLQLPVQSDYQELTEALKWTEKYLHTAIDDMKNTTHYRQMNFDIVAVSAPLHSSKTERSFGANAKQGGLEAALFRKKNQHPAMGCRFLVISEKIGR